MPAAVANAGSDSETPQSIAARLDGTKLLQTQTRWTLGAMAFVSLMMLLTSYNAYFSYAHYLLLEHRDRGDQLSQILTTEEAKDWLSSQFVSVPFLGIRVSVDDTAPLGTAVLCVLSIWLLLVALRENHTVGNLLRDTDVSPPSSDAPQVVTRQYAKEQRWLIFSTIAANSFFITVDPSLSIIRSIHTGKLGRPSRMAERLGVTGFGFIRGFFFLFPIVTFLAVAGLDIRSYFALDPLGTTPAITRYAFYPHLREAFWQTLAIDLLCGLPLVLSCLRASRYSRATEMMLREYGADIRSEPRVL
jgi:hypothetical protein